jgi:hypothetical protein
MDSVKANKLDSEICLFSKILKNEVDEQFWFESQEVKETVKSLVIHFLKERHGKLVQNEISTLVTAVKRDKTEVEKWVWQRVTDRMYDDHDA